MRRYPLALIAAALWFHSPAASQQALPTFSARGFTDFNYLVTERDVPDGYRQGQFAAHMVSSLGERVTFFGELTASATPAGFNVEIERSVLRYDFSDWFKLSAGKYHTPISYWNTAFHHGQWLQTSVARPEMIKFGGSFIPGHFVGILAEGTVPSGPIGLGYAAGVGNGRHRSIARGSDAFDANKHRALNFSLYSRPIAIRGLQVGGAYYTDRASPDATTHVDERITSAHLVLDRESPELLAEYARVKHKPHGVAGVSSLSDAFYVQLGYRLPDPAHSLKPYVRVERVEIGPDDVLFAPLKLGYEALIVGMRHDFSPAAALKAEYRRERFSAPERFGSLILQASLTFPGIDDGGHH